MACSADRWHAFAKGSNIHERRVAADMWMALCSPRYVSASGGPHRTRAPDEQQASDDELQRRALPRIAIANRGGDAVVVRGGERID